LGFLRRYIYYVPNINTLVLSSGKFGHTIPGKIPACFFPGKTGFLSKTNIAAGIWTLEYGKSKISLFPGFQKQPSEK